VFTECTAEHREILAVDEHLAAVDGAPSCDYSVGVGALLQTGGMSAVSGQEIEFVEASRVEQCIDTFASEHLALLVLPLDGPRRTGVSGLEFSCLEVAQSFCNRIDSHETTLVRHNFAG